MSEEKMMAQSGNESADLTQQQLLELLGKEHRKRGPMKYIAIAAVLLIAAAGAAAYYMQSKPVENEVTYRQYTVERGNVTVGTTESSSISLEREVIKFPVSTTVEQIFVKEGQSVKAGDPLMQLNLDEIKAGLVTYELQVKMAQLELEQAKLDQQSKLLKAEQTYKTAVLEGELAASSQSITITNLEKQLADAEEELSDLVEDLYTYRDYERNYDDDYDKVTYWQTKMESYDALYDEYMRKYNDALHYESEIKELKKELAEELAKPDADQDEDRIEFLEEAIKDGEAAIGGMDSDSLYRMAQDAYENYQKAREKYNDRYADFREDYDIEYGDDEELEEKIEELEKKVKDAANALEEAKIKQQTGSLSAEQTKALTELSAQTALAQYNLTELQLSQNVDEAQEIYDQTVRQINDIKESIADDGIVYAPCTGMIVNINLDEGDDFEVTYDEDKDTLNEVTLLTMTDISSVYVPITISEEDILNVYIGQPANVTMNAFEGRTFEAEVDTISVEAARSGAATVSYTVSIRYIGENTLDMYEGMSAETTLLQRQAQDVLYVNNQAITNVDGVATVSRLKSDGSTETVNVKTGFTNGQYVEIISGLEQGDIVVAASGVRRA